METKEALTALVQRSLGILSEIHEVERRMREVLSELTVASKIVEPASSETSETDAASVYRGSMHWNRRAS